MKRSIYLSLALAVLCGSALAAPAKNSRKVPFPPSAELGNVMFVGDSITHGVAAASYRWPLFKIWVDNGISLKEVGVHARNHSGGVAPNTPYGNATFLNVHSAISSERAYEIAGRINQSGRLENSNIFDWLGLDKSYSGNRTIDPASEMPAYFFMMIGTNDTLSDSGKAGIHSCIAETEKNLLGRRGDMDTIVEAMRKANPKANIAVTTIPTWAPGRHNNASPEDYATIERYNEKLKAWGRANKVAVVEVNRGMVDVCGTKEVPFVGLPAMFGRDKLHPSAQGDLIIAGNVAQQLGYAGRTAGLTRRKASAFPVQEGARTLKPSESYSSAAAQAGDGATVEFRFAKNGYGNGAKGGWNHETPMQVRLATSSESGTLNLSEGYISWNGNILYSADMSKMMQPVRMAYVANGAALGVQGGFYIWLGDMLIGEGLSGEPAEGKAGVQVTAGESAARLASVSYDPSASWAPDTKRFSAGNPNFSGTTASVEPPSPDGEAGGARIHVIDKASPAPDAEKLAHADEVQVVNGAEVTLPSLGGVKKLVVDAASSVTLAPGAYDVSVLNSGTIILPKGTTLSLRPEGTDENETGTYVIKGGTLKANNVRMSNNIRVEGGGDVSGLSPETFMGKLEKK